MSKFVTMKCPYCHLAINFETSSANTSYWHKDPDNFSDEGYGFEAGRCPNCQGLIMLILTGEVRRSDVRRGDHCVIYDDDVETTEILFPRNSVRLVELEVPARYNKDFSEAAAVLSISPKASAALSRRILQDVIRDKFGISHPNLAREIEQFIALPDVPTFLREAVDAVRNIGNFAAHPLKDTNTGEIVDVEPGEAEWLLDVLEALFDFAYVQPARLAEKQRKLNEKLNALGKPPMRTNP